MQKKRIFSYEIHRENIIWDPLMKFLYWGSSFGSKKTFFLSFTVCIQIRSSRNNYSSISWIPEWESKNYSKYRVSRYASPSIPIEFRMGTLHALRSDGKNKIYRDKYTRNSPNPPINIRQFRTDIIHSCNFQNHDAILIIQLLTSLVNQKRLLSNFFTVHTALDLWKLSILVVFLRRIGSNKKDRLTLFACSKWLLAAVSMCRRTGGQKINWCIFWRLNNKKFDWHL